MTNQEFCYWLQGYFEISKHISLTKEKIITIASVLDKMNEPLDTFTQWLVDVIHFFSSMHYKQEILDYFLPEIQYKLNSIFYHVIDEKYDHTNLGRKEAKKIHDGFTS